jgi:hypothetical protein
MKFDEFVNRGPAPGWEARVDLGAATSKENETRGVLRASLTMEGVSVVKVDGTFDDVAASPGSQARQEATRE